MRILDIKRIHIKGVMGHASSEVEIPDRGIVLVTGPNGAGKSGLFIEGPAVAIWGKTIRGTPPWMPTIKKKTKDRENDRWASVTLNGLSVFRSSEPKILSWQLEVDGSEAGYALDSLKRLGVVSGHPAATNFETMTKAQEALNGLVRDFDLWRKTQVFSSSDAMNFSTSTDAERKKLMEKILRIDFDSALEACKTDLGLGLACVGRLARDLELNESRSKAIDESSARLTSELLNFDRNDPPVLTGRSSAEVRPLTIEKSKQVEEAQAAYQDLLRTGGMSAARAQQTSRMVKDLEGAAGCPTCGQEIPDDHLAKLKALARTLEAQAEEERASVATKTAEAKARQAELSAELMKLTEEFNRQRQKESAARQHEAERARLVKLIDEAGASLRDLAIERTRVRGEQACSTLSVHLREAVATVLGPRGAPAIILGKALPGIEALANARLSRLRLPLRVELLAYTEKKTGGVTNAISMKVHGAGGGHGYYATSNGERRRIDLAMLFAVSEVSAARHGATPGTIFCDEIFDAIHADAVPAICDMLVELSENRAVIVIVHNEELARRIPATVHYHVEGGQVSCLS